MHTEIEKMMEEEMKEFDRQFVDENLWQGEDEYTKNVPIGNIKSFIRQSQHRLLAKVKEDLGNKIKNRFNGFGGTLGFTQNELLSLLTLPEDKYRDRLCNLSPEQARKIIEENPNAITLTERNPPHPPKERGGAESS